jgi:L-alanine-DL-glutamate epimerase-like enolase superfamily enzyme
VAAGRAAGAVAAPADGLEVTVYTVPTDAPEADVALWDLKARLLGLPLHRRLGSVRDSVPVYGSGGFTTYDVSRLRDQLTSWTDAGIPRIKIKIGESWGAPNLALLMSSPSADLAARTATGGAARRAPARSGSP